MGVSRSDRARQFLPFDALKGLQEALREKEVEILEKYLTKKTYSFIKQIIKFNNNLMFQKNTRNKQF